MLISIVTLPENYHTEAPLNLIEFQGNKFVLNDKALNFIKSIEEEIIVVSIVGKARTGKSYLMNLLLNTTNNKGVTYLLISSLMLDQQSIHVQGEYGSGETQGINKEATPRSFF